MAVYEWRYIKGPFHDCVARSVCVHACVNMPHPGMESVSG